MRTFVAVELDEECRQNLLDAVERLKRVAERVRWARPAQMHLTLKFIGEIEETDTPEAIGCIQEAAAGVGPFTMRVEGLDSFPGRGKPRIIYAPVEEPTGALEKLHDRVEEALADELGIAPENRKYIPHITLGRVKDRGAVPMIDEFAAALDDRHFGVVEVDSFVLMKSDLKPSGAEYTELHRFSLD